MSEEREEVARLKEGILRWGGLIDAPELRSAKCPLELFRAEAAKDRLAAIIAPIQTTGCRMRAYSHCG